MGTNYGLPTRTGCATNDMKSLNKSKECTPICFAIYYSLQYTWMNVYLMLLWKDDPELRVLLLNIMKGANLYSQVQVTEPQCSKKGKEKQIVEGGFEAEQLGLSILGCKDPDDQ